MPKLKKSPVTTNDPSLSASLNRRLSEASSGRAPGGGPAGPGEPDLSDQPLLAPPLQPTSASAETSQSNTGPMAVNNASGAQQTQGRYASDNAALEEMEELCRGPKRTDLKSLVTEESQVGSGSKFSEDDLEAHFRGSEYARPHEPLRPVATKKKKRKPDEANKDEHTAAESATPRPSSGDTAELVSETPHHALSQSGSSGTAKEPLPLSALSSAHSTAPVVDARAALASPPTQAQDKVMFQIGNEDAEPEEQSAAGGDGEEARERRGKRHHHRHHVQDLSARRQPGSERQPRSMVPAGSRDPQDDADELQQEISSHRYDSGPRMHRVMRKEDRIISNVVHLGDVNTGQTLLLGKKNVDHTPHGMYVELDELTSVRDQLEWKETARWIKYEEDVEQEGKRWGKPHLASLPFLSLMSLRRCLETCAILLDVEEHDSVAISHRVTTKLLESDMIKQRDFGAFMRTLLLRRQHVRETVRGLRDYMGSRNMSRHRLQSISAIRNGSQLSLHDPSEKGSIFAGSHRTSIGAESEGSDAELNRFMSHHNILRHMASGTEVVSVNVGLVDFIDKPVSAFVRLDEGTFLPGITEVPLPVRFLFFYIAPMGYEENVHETGRAFATVMSSSVFNEAAYKATGRTDLMWGFKEFLDETLVLPPIAWSNPDVLDVAEMQRQSREMQERRLKKQKKEREAALAQLAEKAASAGGKDVTKQRDASANGTGRQSPSKDSPHTSGGDGDGDDPLVRVGKPFAGIIRDIKRRFPFYLSDFKDGLNIPVFSATFFIFFAALAGAITFGGLMMDKTKLQIGISETLIATSLTGVIFALFSCQPLIIIGATGPLLLFDEALFAFCKSNEIEFLPMRVWIAIWLLVVCLVMVGFEGSVLVKKFTLFTTEIFSALISILFIYESLSKLATVFMNHPLLENYCSASLNVPASNTTGNATGAAAPQLPPRNQPNTAYLSLLLMFGTFFIANYLRKFRNSQFLSRRVRRMLGDFGVPIAILLMVGLKQLIPMVYTQRLEVPSGLTPSNSTLRGWIISPLGLNQSITWLSIVGAIPASVLILIVIYMETMVCQLIMAKPERNLRKGTGFHCDILLLAALNVITALIGAPWMCAATIRSVSHVAALTVFSETYAPGEKPRIVGVHEQRLSALVVSVLVGLSVVLSFVLKLIPVAVVFGIFMYMGISSMTGVQLLERCVLFLMPVKHHPDEVYVKKVRTWRMHLFTLIQLVCLGFLLGIKFTPAAIGFPFFLALLIPLRLLLLPKLFTNKEISALDGGNGSADNDDADFYEEAHQIPTTMSLGNFHTNFNQTLIRMNDIDSKEQV